MRASILSILMLALMIAGCDKPMPPAGQGNGTIDDASLSGNAANAASPDEATGSGNAAAPASASLTGVIDRSHAGSAAPTASFTAPDGKPVTLAAFRGKPVLVNLWATWCAPCVKEMPTLDEAALAEKDHLQVIAVSQDMEGSAKVAPFFAKAKFAALQPYLDPQLGLSLALKVNLPTTIMYDASGREIWRVTGGYDWTSPAAIALLKGTGRSK